MKQNIIEQALNIIRARKKKNQDELREKLAVLEKDEDFATLEKKYTALVIENKKKEAYGEVPNEKEEKALFQKLQQTKSRYGLEDVKLHYDCPLCKDEGLIDGKQCRCLKTEISKLILEGSGFEKLESFEKAIPTAQHLTPVYEKMQQWCNANSAKNLIYLAGPTGVGKTHLMRCMANELIKNGKVVNIVTSLSLSIDFKTFSKNLDEEILKKYLTPDVLFIDDLGTEPIFKNVTIEYLYLVINERKMKNKKTVITSNLDLGDVMDRYDERIFSRIVDKNTSITLFLDGDDRRLIKK